MSISDWIQIVLGIFAFLGLIGTFIGIFIAWKSGNQQIKNANQLALLEIKNSNKQALFDKRLDIFMLSECLKNLIRENEDILEIPESFDVMNPFHFREMINNTYLNELADVMPEPMDVDGPSPIDSPEAQRNFLIKKEDMLRKSQAAELIFEKPENIIIANFISDYVALLDGRRRYEIMLKSFWKFEKQERQNPKFPDISTEEYLEQHTDEKEYREKLLIEPIKKLSHSYKLYCDTQEKIKTQITLRKGKS